MFQVVIFMGGRGSRESNVWPARRAADRVRLRARSWCRSRRRPSPSGWSPGTRRRSGRRRNRSPSRRGSRAKPGRSRTLAPDRSSTTSSAAAPGTRSNLYWKPEQPPPSTLTRSARAAASPATISAMRLAARSVTVTASLIDGLEDWARSGVGCGSRESLPTQDKRDGWEFKARSKPRAGAELALKTAANAE